MSLCFFKVFFHNKVVRQGNGKETEKGVKLRYENEEINDYAALMTESRENIQHIVKKT